MSVDQVLGHDAAGLPRTADPLLAQLRNLLDSTSDAYLCADEDGVLVDVNRAASQLFGRPEEELIGQRGIDLIAPAEAGGDQRDERGRLLHASATASARPSEVRIDRVGDRAVAMLVSIWRTQHAGEGLLHWLCAADVPRTDGAARPGRIISALEDLATTATTTATATATAQAAMAAAGRDSLTGLPDRQLFCELVDDALAGTQGDPAVLAVLLVDLDGFRDVNDGLGQRAGDLVLEETARRLLGAVRQIDVVARFGNDEFAVLLRGLGAAEDAFLVATTARSALETPFDVDGVRVHISGSIGIAVAPDHASERGALIQRADVALARAQSLRSGWAVYRSDEDDVTLGRLALAADLRAAIAGEELDVHYQPIVETRSRRVVRLEALARWHHPERGPVPPDQFIALAEQTDLIDPLTRVILRKAATACAGWRRDGHDVHVAVNLSIQVLAKTDFEPVVVEELSRAGLSPQHLTLEITESALAEDVQRLGQALTSLRELGVCLVIDDFGTGYSAMSYLKQLPLEELKIDRSFVQTIDADARDISIVQSLVRLAHSLDLRVVAEGVESVAAVELLDDVGCDRVQGYGIARPMPDADVATWLDEAAQVRRPERKARPAPHPAPRPRNLLIVEDSETVRRLLARRAADAGWTVRQAGSAEEALTEVAVDVPDVVVLDHHLPGMSGVQAIPRLRAAVHGPILLFTRFLSEAMPELRVPLDVWPVSKADPDAVLELLAAYRVSAR
jgi:diguanylate cyclase (GGDEF)-like protein/PAS domain S-box-containing protein